MFSKLDSVAPIRFHAYIMAVCVCVCVHVRAVCVGNLRVVKTALVIAV